MGGVAKKTNEFGGPYDILCLAPAELIQEAFMKLKKLLKDRVTCVCTGRRKSPCPHNTFVESKDLSYCSAVGDLFPDLVDHDFKKYTYYKNLNTKLSVYEATLNPRTLHCTRSFYVMSCVHLLRVEATLLRADSGVPLQAPNVDWTNFSSQSLSDAEWKKRCDSYCSYCLARRTMVVLLTYEANTDSFPSYMWPQALDSPQAVEPNAEVNNTSSSTGKDMGNTSITFSKKCFDEGFEKLISKPLPESRTKSSTSKESNKSVNRSDLPVCDLGSKLDKAGEESPEDA